MPREIPMLNLEQVSILAASDNPAYEYFHTMGIFEQECQARGATCWKLRDEIKQTAEESIIIRLRGPLDQYPKPKFGDIVRIHRLTIVKILKTPEVTHARNVVVWPAFKFKPEPISVARRPTIEDDDETRRRQLEVLVSESIHHISDIQNNNTHPPYFYNIAGRVIDRRSDSYGHINIHFEDGTGQMILRVFAKSNEKETDAHFIEASQLNPGDFLFAQNAKFIDSRKLNLSANHQFGRCLRRVEKESILGIKLMETIRETDTQTQTQTQTPALTTTTTTTTNPPALPACTETIPETNPENDAEPDLIPKFVTFEDIQLRQGTQYLDIAGHVRGAPHEASKYNNLVIQLYSGIRHDFIDCFSEEIKEPQHKCLALYIYSKQKEQDTDEHIKKAQTLKDGDLVFVKNVTVSFSSGKIKLVLNANKRFDKSINVIDKESPFGMKLLDIFETPRVAELDGQPANQSFSSSLESSSG